MKISVALYRVSRLGIDTAPYICFVENHPNYADKMEAIFQLVETESIEAITSVLALTETLMKPMQAEDMVLVQAYREMLGETEYVRLIPVNSKLAEEAAKLRAKYKLRTPDALHIATAIESGCTTFLTNDKGLQRISELRVLILDELELDPP